MYRGINMAKNNGHWYTDKNGNHYFVENGQSPKEGWEESKRRKMISGGKYMTSEDGNDYSEVDKDKYDAYEADEADFDENVDDDFGFDEEEDNYTSTIDEMRQDGVNVDDPREVMQYLGANMGLDREDQVSFMERLGYSVNDIEKLRNPGDDFEDDDEFDDAHLSYEEIFTDNDNAQIEKYAEHYEVDASELKDAIHQKALDYIREGDSITNAKDDAMESILEDVASGEYNREMKKAQEQNADMSEGELANNNYKAYEADIKRFTTKGQKLDLIQDIKEDDSLTQLQKNELINKIRNTQTTLNDDEQRERVSELEGDRLFNIDMKSGSQGKYKYGKDSQNRFYVDDETGYRQYFTRENEARDYADRMNAAQGSSPDNNVKEYTDKNGEKVKEFSSDKDAEKWFDEHQNELPDGAVLYGNKVYVGKDSSQNYNYEDEGHYYKDGRWKPGNHKTNQWAPEYYTVRQKRVPNEPGQYEKDYTGDFPSLEKAQEFASKYQGRYPLNISKLQHQGNGSYRSIENQEYKRQSTGTQGNQEKISKVKNLVDKGILSKEDWTRFMNGSLSDEELIKKILG